MFRTNKRAKRSNIFKSTAQASNISKKLQTFYENKEYCDVVLIAGVDDVEVKAHRIILLASNDWFVKMFRQELEEAKTGVIKIKEIDGITLNLIIQFFYTASIELHSENIENLLKAAHFFQMDELLYACCDFLEDEIDFSNCLGIAFFAKLYDCTKVHEQARLFANKNFEKVCTEEEFVELNETQLNEWASSSEFSCSEEVVVQSFVAWVEYDKSNREKHIFNILKSRSEFLLSKRRRKLAYIIEGEYAVTTLDEDSNIWSTENLPAPLDQRSDYAVTSINNNIIIVGGIINGDITNAIECLDLFTKKWIHLPPMSIARVNPQIAALNGHLYVVGGSYNEELLYSMEIYNFSTQKWDDVLNLTFAPSHIAADGGFLYATANDSFRIQCYDIAVKKWTQMKNGTDIGSILKIAAIDGVIYLVSNSNTKNTNQCYSYSRKILHNISSKHDRDFIPNKCVALNKKLIVCGSNYNRYSVFEYEPSLGSWTSLSSFPKHRNRFTLLTI